jgi:hypothetical protein
MYLEKDDSSADDKEQRDMGSKAVVVSKSVRLSSLHRGDAKLGDSGKPAASMRSRTKAATLFLEVFLAVDCEGALLVRLRSKH